jgi:leucyl-tRNA synthetase
MFEKGIAYRGKTLSNWCPTDQTVLANEHVENGKCWRCGDTVVQKEVEQWFLKITDYAEKLLWNKDGNGVDWPNSVMTAQNEWIGRKSGIEITFDVADSKEKVTVFTTTPINFGATFIVVAPEHPIVAKITTSEQKEAVQKYLKEAAEKTELDRMSEGREKTGVFTGSYAINHVNGKKIPIWVADYALIKFGTGAVQGCPGHDQKDFEFAKKFGIPTPRVVVGPHGETGPITEKADQVKSYVKAGVMMNSEFLDGIEFTEAMEKTKDYFEEKGWGRRVVTYHLHDWSVSRQRYWGTPVPMIHCERCGIVPVPENQLPVELPYNVDYQPKGKPPLASNEEWLKITCPNCGGEAKRDAETLDTFFDSSWYYYRYVDPHYDNGPFDPEKIKEFMPVDIYFGGGEHTLGHTLYARFFTKFFKDLGLVEFDEFAKKRVQHGIVLGPDGNKMSKSKGNVINPDDVVKEFGTDAVRVYLSFMMPYAATGPWAPGAMYGSFRFLKRVWDLQSKVGSVKREALSNKDLYEMHRTIKKVTEDLSETRNNTAVAALMEWLNYLESKVNTGSGVLSVEEYQTFLLLLAPIAPYMTEEIWQALSVKPQTESNKIKGLNASGFTLDASIHKQSWPVFDSKYLVADTVVIAVQINGKLRETIEIQNEKIKNKNDVEEMAKQSEKVQKHLEGKEVKKIIYVPGKILNFVVV